MKLKLKTNTQRLDLILPPPVVIALALSLICTAVAWHFSAGARIVLPAILFSGAVISFASFVIGVALGALLTMRTSRRAVLTANNKSDGQQPTPAARR